MNVKVSLLAVLLAVVAKMVVGMVWYAKPVFGTEWAKMVRLDDKKMQKGAAKAIVLSLVVGLVTAYVLAHVSYIANNFFKNSFLEDSLMTAFWLWLGFVAATVVTHDAFEQRRKKLTAFTLGNELVSIMAMGLIIGLIKP